MKLIKIVLILLILPNMCIARPKIKNYFLNGIQKISYKRHCLPCIALTYSLIILHFTDANWKKVKESYLEYQESRFTHGGRPLFEYSLSLIQRICSMILVPSIVYYIIQDKGQK